MGPLHPCQTTTTKPFVPSIWGRLHEPKENYAWSGIWISFLHSFLSSNMPSLRPLTSISCHITSIHVFFGLPCALCYKFLSSLIDVLVLNLWFLFLILQGKYHSFHPVATILSYLTKAPLVSEFFFRLFERKKTGFSWRIQCLDCFLFVVFETCRFHQGPRWWMHSQSRGQCWRTSWGPALVWPLRTTWSWNTSELSAPWNWEPSVASWLEKREK